MMQAGRFALIVLLMVLASITLSQTARAQGSKKIDLFFTAGNADYVDSGNKITIPLYNGFSSRERNLASYVIEYSVFNVGGLFAYRPNFYYELDPAEIMGRTRSVNYQAISKYPDLARRYQAIRPLSVNFVIKAILEIEGGEKIPVRFMVNDKDLVYLESRSARRQGHLLFPPTLKAAFSTDITNNAFSSQDSSDEKAIRELLLRSVSVLAYDLTGALIKLEIKWPEDAIDEIGRLYEEYQQEDEALELRGVRGSWTPSELNEKKAALNNERKVRSDLAISRLAGTYKKEFSIKSKTSPAVQLKGVVYTNEVGMELLYVPSGEFVMGLSEAEITALAEVSRKARYNERTIEVEREEYKHEGPQRRVSITDGFWMGIFEVTQSQWRSVMGNSPASNQDCANCPVANINWDEIEEFLERLNKTSKELHYTLPSESQWEYAARGGKQGLYDSTKKLDEVSWYSDNSNKRTHPAGLKVPNDFGLFDLQGNVNEWCSDTYNSTYEGLPTDGTPNLTKSESLWWGVIRGGAFPSGKHDMRFTARVKFSRFTTQGFNDLGFRVVAHPKNNQKTERLNDQLKQVNPLRELIAHRGYASIIADYTKALKNNPQWFEGYVERGKTFFQIRETDEAIRDFTSALDLKPEDRGVLKIRAEAYQSKSDWDHELKDLSKVIELGPREIGSYYLRATSYMRLGQSGQAIEDYSKMIELEPSASHYFWRAIAFQKNKEPDKAIADLNVAIGLEPKGIYLATRSSIHREKQEYEKALGDLAIASRLYAEERQRKLQKINDENAAEAAKPAGQPRTMTSTSVDDSYLTTLSSMRGNIFMDMKDYAKAVVEYTKALEQWKSPHLYLKRAEAYKALGNAVLAEADIKKANDLK